MVNENVKRCAQPRLKEAAFLPTDGKQVLLMKF